MSRMTFFQAVMSSPLEPVKAETALRDAIEFGHIVPLDNRASPDFAKEDVLKLWELAQKEKTMKYQHPETVLTEQYDAEKVRLGAQKLVELGWRYAGVGDLVYDGFDKKTANKILKNKNYLSLKALNVYGGTVKMSEVVTANVYNTLGEDFTVPFKDMVNSIKSFLPSYSLTIRLLRHAVRKGHVACTHIYERGPSIGISYKTHDVFFTKCGKDYLENLIVASPESRPMSVYEFCMDNLTKLPTSADEDGNLFPFPIMEAKYQDATCINFGFDMSDRLKTGKLRTFRRNSKVSLKVAKAEPDRPAAADNKATGVVATINLKHRYELTQQLKKLAVELESRYLADEYYRQLELLANQAVAGLD